MITTRIRAYLKGRVPFHKSHTHAFDEDAAALLKQAAAGTAADACRLLQTTTAGLTETEARARQAQYGLNEIHQEKAPAWYLQLIRSFLFPFNAVLVIIAAVSCITDVILAAPGQADYKTVILLSSMILLSSLIRFWQEFRSNQAADTLKNMIRTTAAVLRSSGKPAETDIRQLVPGDIVYLSAGDLIPADCRVLQSKDLFISQSMLTGESVPVEKKQERTDTGQNSSILELDTICFMGTAVESGSATALVITTGNRTYFGSLSKAIMAPAEETGFSKGVRKVSYLLIRFMLVMVPLVFVINGLTKHNWLEALLFAITVAVGLTPEMLPMIVTTNLARGAVSMSRQKVIVKRLEAIQNIGAMDVLCTDKTGTLTMDKIVLEKHLNVLGQEDDEVLKWAYLNSFYQTGLRNLMDQAILDHGDLPDLQQVESQYEKVDEIPFDFHRRRMSVILKQKDGRHLLICKGAVEEMLDHCTMAFDPGEDHQVQIDKDRCLQLDADSRQKILTLSRQLNADGLRILLIAVREFENRALTYSVADEQELIVTGFVGFLDPAKPSAKASIEALQQLGVQIKVLTGDNEVVTRKICSEVNIASAHCILGAEMEQLDDTALGARIDEITVFAKLSPVQKSRVIKLLQARGHTVGFMGDGINDAAALKDADVGISVDTAVDIAKESADIILLEKDLMVLRQGVLYGRRTFGNIIKYIKMAASSNFGNMFSMLGASALLPFLPMLPVQILIQNLLYDISQISIPWDRMDNDYLNVPRKWDASGISRFMIFIGPVSSLFDYITFAVLYFVFQAQTPAGQSLFQSGWFVEGLISQTLIVHLIRTRKIPFIQSRASAPVIAFTVFIMALAVIIPFSPLAPAFKMQALPLAYFPWLAGILVAYSLCTQFVKTLFIRKFGYWL